jgi:hypothetical protein
MYFTSLARMVLIIPDARHFQSFGLGTMIIAERSEAIR